MNARIDITNVTLKTKRLTLRPWQEEDLQDLYDYAHVEGVGQMAGWNPHKDLEESRQILKLFIEGKRTFALEYEGTVIGSLGVEEYQEAHYPELAELSGREILSMSSIFLCTLYARASVFNCASSNFFCDISMVLNGYSWRRLL